jgi:hypothetical protein
MPEIAVHEGTGTENLTYKGEPAVYKITICSIDTGRGFIIELHQVIEGESTFKQFLDEHGQGLHHLGFEVGDERDAIVGEFEKNAYAIRQLGFYPGSSWTIVDTEDTLGVNLNIKPHR